jgi:ABC-type Na+ efflux pump permease subunit
MMESAVSVKNLTKTYGKIQAISGIDFTVAENEVFALIGPNGAGKSTTLRILATVLQPGAGDTKSAQGVITPLMILIMIPYFLALFLDISSLSPIIRWFVYAIPFAHPFLAPTNLILGHYQNVIYGIIYMAAFFLVFVYLASKLFSSDKIFTLKISFKRKK